jgi:hypothetical protein
MKNEIVIFPNPNQEIILRNIQKELCALINENHEQGLFAVPILPTCIKNDELTSMESKISKVLSDGVVRHENNFVLQIQMNINEKDSLGKIELCRIFEEKSKNNLAKELVVKKISETQLSPQIKFNSFRIVRIETENCQTGIKWKVLEEKWKKL